MAVEKHHQTTGTPYSRRRNWPIVRLLADLYAAIYLVNGGVVWGVGLAPPGTYGAAAVVGAFVFIALVLILVLAAVVREATLLGAVLVLIVVVTLASILRRGLKSSSEPNEPDNGSQRTP